MPGQPVGRIRDHHVRLVEAHEPDHLRHHRRRRTRAEGVRCGWFTASGHPGIRVAEFHDVAHAQRTGRAVQFPRPVCGDPMRVMSVFTGFRATVDCVALGAVGTRHQNGAAAGSGVAGQCATRLARLVVGVGVHDQQHGHPTGAPPCLPNPFRHWHHPAPISPDAPGGEGDLADDLRGRADSAAAGDGRGLWPSAARSTQQE